MDKYIHKDDANDDLGVYRGENYEGLTFIHLPKGGIPQQKTKAVGKTSESWKELIKAYKKLSPKQLKLTKYILKGKSIKDAARLMKIKQQTAQEYWEIIKEKLK